MTWAMNDSYSYEWHELAYLALAPARAVSDIARVWFKSPLIPLSHTPVGRNVAASAELFERLTRRYGKPVFGLDATVFDGRTVPIIETIVWERPFCRLLHFERHCPPAQAPQPNSSSSRRCRAITRRLLRGTVEAFLPTHRRLHHRLGRRAHGAADRRALSISTTTSTISIDMFLA